MNRTEEDKALDFRTIDCGDEALRARYKCRLNDLLGRGWLWRLLFRYNENKTEYLFVTEKARMAWAYAQRGRTIDPWCPDEEVGSPVEETVSGRTGPTGCSGGGGQEIGGLR